jgi:hypothetical protein
MTGSKILCQDTPSAHTSFESQGPYCSYGSDGARAWSSKSISGAINQKLRLGNEGATQCKRVMGR